MKNRVKQYLESYNCEEPDEVIEDIKELRFESG